MYYNNNKTPDKYNQKFDYVVNNDIWNNNNINDHKTKAYVDNVDNIYKHRHNYTFTEKSFEENSIINNNKSEKLSCNKYLENILNNRYSIKELLYCYNQGISTKDFFLKFKQNLENIFGSDESYENILEYLFENIPKLIRNILSKKDLKFIFEQNNCDTVLGLYKNENNTYIEDDCCYAREYIKKLILNDNKYIVQILNKYYDNVNSIINKNKLVNNKNNFIQEMKNLNADIALS